MEMKIITKEEAIQLGLASNGGLPCETGRGATKYLYGGTGPASSTSLDDDVPEVGDKASPLAPNQAMAMPINPETGKEMVPETFRIEIASGKKEILTKNEEYVPEEDM